MKSIFIFAVVAVFEVFILFTSCHKEYSCEGCINGNFPPVANAGPDQTITLPVDHTILDGTASSDPDKDIISYAWKKISGYSSFTIANEHAVKSDLYGLVEGTYHFELIVTDAGGLYDKDTISIVVQSQEKACVNNGRQEISAKLISVGNLSVARSSVSAVTINNKIFFAGGWLFAFGAESRRVDIFDITTQSWSQYDLSIGRVDMATVAAGNKLFFAGGLSEIDDLPSDVVDMYDAATESWSVAHLSAAGTDITATTIGSKVFFAGGGHGVYHPTTGINRASRVDIYDLNTNTWSTASLSEPKFSGHLALTQNNKIYIAGGTIPTGISGWSFSNKIDVYDDAANTWSTTTMVEGKSGFSGIAVANKIFLAGGFTGDNNDNHVSCLVEVLDQGTGNVTTNYLYQPSWSDYSNRHAVVQDGKICFLWTGKTKFDIYDTRLESWSIGVLPKPIPIDASIIAANNTIYIAGGTTSNQLVNNHVWKLQF